MSIFTQGNVVVDCYGCQEQEHFDTLTEANQWARGHLQSGCTKEDLYAFREVYTNF